MSGSFTGFSEDDIRKLNNQNPEKTIQPPAKGNPKIKTNKRAGNSKIQAGNANPIHNTSESRSKILNEKIQNSRVEPISEGAKLSKPPEAQNAVVHLNQSCDKVATKTNTQKLPTSILTSTQCTDELRNKIKFLHGESISEDKLDTAISSTSSNNGNVATNSNENETKKMLPEKKLDLDEFQARQKLMEEQNRKRKELLTKALAVKTKQTQEEAQKLNEIRDEFKKLDALLSNDVKILRQEIEIASLDYMEAQKRYFRIEKEFLDAKLVLHQKVERKEMLTEHLCAIIEKNEERKADKLNELLLKLNMKADVQEDNSNSNLEASHCLDEKNDLEPTNVTNMQAVGNTE